MFHAGIAFVLSSVQTKPDCGLSVFRILPLGILKTGIIILIVAVCRRATFKNAFLRCVQKNVYCRYCGEGVTMRSFSNSGSFLLVGIAPDDGVALASRVSLAPLV